MNVVACVIALVLGILTVLFGNFLIAGGGLLGVFDWLEVEAGAVMIVSGIIAIVQGLIAILGSALALEKKKNGGILLAIVSGLAVVGMILTGQYGLFIGIVALYVLATIMAFVGAKAEAA